MTETERLILMNQYAILEFLSIAHPEVAQRGIVIHHDPNTYRWYQSILANGYDLLMPEITGHVYKLDLSKEEQQNILDILEMWGDLQIGFDQLKDKKDLTENDVRFPGWDGNSTKGELSFARLYCFRGEEETIGDKKQTKPDRFDYVKPSPAYNGHAGLMGMYDRMLETYNSISESRKQSEWDALTYEQIKTIIAAKVHPSNRK